MGKIVYIGAGPGSKEYLLPVAAEAAKKCEVLILLKDQMHLFEGHQGMIVEKDYKEIITLAKKHVIKGDVGIVLMGDPTLISLLGLLEEELSDIKSEIIPGISCTQVLISKLGESFSDPKIFSVHNKHMTKDETIAKITSQRQTFVLFGRQHTPYWLCEALIDAGLGDIDFAVGEHLTFANERIVNGTPCSVLEDVRTMTDMSVARIICDDRDL